MAGQPFVDEGVVGGQQIEDAAIVAELAVKEQLGLALEGLAQVVVELGKQIGVRRMGRTLRR